MKRQLFHDFARSAAYWFLVESDTFNMVFSVVFGLVTGAWAGFLITNAIRRIFA